MKRPKDTPIGGSLFINDLVSTGVEFQQEVSRIPTNDSATRLTLQVLSDELLVEQGLDPFGEEDDMLSVMMWDEEI
ncbi:hypothetical protein GW793_00380 [bacterium]|uniref:Uncharacterized protein n=1 Tax=candidate division WWE3 bacterium CG_4_9_14_3_um_filter_39_7 TaxID=1975080 RepID=A0A2M7X3H8_UNCKA|nr:hypothetical protein [bacterium]PJA40700.1 MAG: hypothetical protein CO179_01560 [candidate division WWE3 bacterium CG_4_9_14_3_um_filter_39_7]